MSTAEVTNEMIKKAKDEMLAKEKELEEARKKVDALQQVAFESAPHKMEKKKSTMRAEAATSLAEGHSVVDRARGIAKEESPFSKLGPGHHKKQSSKDILAKAKELKSGQIKGHKTATIEQGLAETAAGTVAAKRLSNTKAAVPPSVESPKEFEPTPATTLPEQSVETGPIQALHPIHLEPEADPNWVDTPRPLSESVGVGAGKYLEKSNESILAANTAANACILPKAPEKPKRLSGNQANESTLGSVRKGEADAPRLPQPPPKPKRLSGNIKK